MTNRCLLENCLTTWPVAPTDLCGDCDHPLANHIEADESRDGRCLACGAGYTNWHHRWITSLDYTDAPPDCCGEFVPKPEYCCDDHWRIAKNLDDADAIGDNQRDRDR